MIASVGVVGDVGSGGSGESGAGKGGSGGRRGSGGRGGSGIVHGLVNGVASAGVSANFRGRTVFDGDLHSRRIIEIDEEQRMMKTDRSLDWERASARTLSGEDVESDEEEREELQNGVMGEG